MAEEQARQTETVTEDRIILNGIDIPGLDQIDVYIANGGYRAVEKVFREGLTPDQVIDTVKVSGLAGRGGAWFPAGVKWGFMPKEPKRSSYLCVNCDESEPGTFKDRILVEKNPHQLLEGAILTAYAIRAHVAYIYIRGEMTRGMQSLNQAIAQAREKGYIGQDILGSGYHLNIYTHPGAGAYICGEESALMESLEGKRGYPRRRPPYPVQYGIFGHPTTINNVQTLSYVPHIINNGPDWFRRFGTEKFPGTFIFCLSGHVNRPGVYEVSIGKVTLRRLIYDFGGGVPGNRAIKAVIPGGASVPPLVAGQLDTVMAPDSFTIPGRGPVEGMFGNGAVMVLDETTCMVDALLNIITFFAHESCGQCTPCREGAPWLKQMLHHLEDGHGKAGDIDKILDVANRICPFLGKWTTICPFGAAYTYPVIGTINMFRDEFEAHIETGCCPVKKAFSPQRSTIS